MQDFIDQNDLFHNFVTYFNVIWVVCGEITYTSNIFGIDPLRQACTTRGPRAACGPQGHFIWPAWEKTYAIYTGPILILYTHYIDLQFSLYILFDKFLYDILWPPSEER